MGLDEISLSDDRVKLLKCLLETEIQKKKSSDKI